MGFALDDDLLAVLRRQPDVYTAVAATPGPLDLVSLLLEELRDFLLEAARMQTVPPRALRLRPHRMVDLVLRDGALVRTESWVVGLHSLPERRQDGPTGARDEESRRQKQ